jgi:hypothetical protein
MTLPPGIRVRELTLNEDFDVRHLRFLGPPRPPDANERGWKETVRMNPGECTTVIMKIRARACTVLRASQPTHRRS